MLGPARPLLTAPSMAYRLPPIQGAKASRIESPRRLNANTSDRMARPGNVATYH